MFLYLLILSINYVIQIEASYIGAVIEFSPTLGDTPEETILKNLNYLRDKVADAHQANARIVVFPEYGITTRFIDDDLEDYAINLSENNRVITELKNMAVDYNIYIVANIIERITDTTNKTIYYNTNLVFDTNRNIIAKYRKMNLWREPKLTPGNTTVQFTTNFNVKFGLASSSDLLSERIMHDIVDDGVLEIVCPSAWTSAMPFYTSLSIHHGYAQANGVNLLVASYNYPKDGLGGSGIYLADGTIAETFIDGARGTKLIVKTIPTATDLNNRSPLSCDNNNTTVRRLLKDKRTLSPFVTPNITNFITRRIFNSNSYHFKMIDLTKTNQTNEICYGSFCCKFTINIDLANTNEMYKLMIYDGIVQFDHGDDKVNMKICSLLSCKSNNIDSCGERINGTTRFNSIKISSKLPLVNNRTVYQPITLKYDMQPIATTKYCGSVNSNNQWEMEFKFDNTPQEGLLVFGMIGFNSCNLIKPLEFMIFGIVSILIRYL